MKAIGCSHTAAIRPSRAEISTLSNTHECMTLIAGNQHERLWFKFSGDIEALQKFEVWITF
jgi:hypothetical protein